MIQYFLSFLFLSVTVTAAVQQAEPIDETTADVIVLTYQKTTPQSISAPESIFAPESNTEQEEAPSSFDNVAAVTKAKLNARRRELNSLETPSKNGGVQREMLDCNNCPTLCCGTPGLSYFCWSTFGHCSCNGCLGRRQLSSSDRRNNNNDDDEQRKLNSPLLLDEPCGFRTLNSDETLAILNQAQVPPEEQGGYTFYENKNTRLDECANYIQQNL